MATSARKDSRRRIGLTVPPELDRVLDRISQATGTGKASFVREWLVNALPQLDQLARALELANQGNRDALDVLVNLTRDVQGKASSYELDLASRIRKPPRLRKKKAS